MVMGKQDPLIVKTRGTFMGERNPARIAGRRITVGVIQDELAAGWTVEEICADHDLTPEQVEAAAAYGKGHSRGKGHGPVRRSNAAAR